ncbi:heterokaryon incompatibility protein-domain-containing protein [Aspergillus carlsbadensis]|nr:heterokaryon incompatibility protein-domain-containing protein [Aspergillus carlsbadensis]
MPDDRHRSWWENSLEKNIDKRKEAHSKHKLSLANLDLCATCQKIDFGYLLFGNTETARRQHAHETVYLGTLEEIWHQALDGCPFCADIVLPNAREVFQVYCIDLPQSTPAPRDDSVLVGLVIRDDLITSYMATFHRSYGFNVCVEVQNGGERPPWASAQGTPLQAPISSGMRTSERPVCLMNHELSAYRSLKPRADLDMCKRWLDICCDQHERCRHQKISEKSASSSSLPGPGKANNPFFKLIDVTKREVVVLGDEGAHRYATLSYVCGPAYTLCVLQESVGWKQDEKGTWRHPLPTELPDTIEDALIVTARLGLQYLWVDSICIAQDNADEKQAQILAMYDIYAHAEICIVAASGEDSKHGLPGVRVSRRLAGSAAGVALQSGQFAVVGSLQPALNETLKSYRWMRRAWTYQEVILARRCLIFTETEAYFFCSQDTFKESLMENGTHAERDYWMTDVWGNIDFMTMTSVTQESRMDANFGETAFDNYGAAMREYTRRELTYQEDGLNAFRGMERLLGDYMGCETMAGCPLPLLANCLEWQLQDILCAEEDWPVRRMLRDRKDGKNESDLHLIPLLPSWAWAGWKGALRLRRAKKYPPGSELRILEPNVFSPIPDLAIGSRYKFALTAGSSEQKGRFLKDTLPALAKVSRGHFQVTAMDDAPGYLQISTLDGQVVGECDVRGTHDTKPLSAAQDAILLQLHISPKEGTLNFTSIVLLIQLHDLLESRPELAQRLVTEAGDAKEIQTFPQQPLSASARKRVMLHECPSELVVSKPVPLSLGTPLVATRLGLGWVKGDVWRESRPDISLVFLV